MALKGALENELLSHVVGSSARCSIDLRRQFGGGYRIQYVKFRVGERPKRRT
jgi:hypothetical protein